MKVAPFTPDWLDRLALRVIMWARPISDGKYRWCGVDWCGVPYPLREIAAEFSDRFKDQGWPGCGCIARLKELAGGSCGTIVSANKRW